MKRDKYDIVFSKLIRARAGYRCEKCNTQHATNSMGLHCSHHFGRRHKSVRWDTDNAAALCFTCHNWFGENPVAASRWLKEYYSEDFVDALEAKAYKVKKWGKEEKEEMYLELKRQLAELEG